jgi:hypothetical protein
MMEKYNGSSIQKDEIEIYYIQLHNRVKEKLDHLVTLQGRGDGCSYDIKNYEAIDYYFQVNVEYYKYQQTNFDVVIIPYNLFYDQEKYDLFYEENMKKYNDRKADQDNTQKKIESNKILAAKKLLEKSGFKVTE